MHRAAILLLPLLSLAACGGDDGAGSADAGYDCSVEDRDDTFVAGIEKPGDKGALTFRIMSSMPAPPSRGDNTWTLDIRDGNGGVAGAAVTVSPFMPDHRHGGGIKAVITDQGDGRYQATPVNLWMPGLWEITVEARPAGGTADRAVFRFCIAS